MSKTVVKTILILAALLILFFLFIRFIEKISLYHPYRKIDAAPDSVGLDYEEVFITTKDGVRISAWFIPSRTPRATILCSHGNGGNISHRLEKIRMLHDLDVNVFVYDYRGYGMSTGRPSEAGLYLDAQTAYDYLMNVKKVPAGKIVGYGESLGGAVTIELARKRMLGGIILEGSFTSIRDMARRYFPFVPSFVYKTTFNSIDKIKDIKVPKLIMHGAADEIVPFEQGRRLFDAASGPKMFVELHGGHNDSFIISRDVYLEKIDSFLNRIQKGLN